MRIRLFIGERFETFRVLGIGMAWIVKSFHDFEKFQNSIYSYFAASTATSVDRSCRFDRPIQFDKTFRESDGSSRVKV